MSRPTNGEQLGFWGAVVATVITQGAALLMFLRSRKGDERAKAQELALKAEEQEFDHEMTLRQRLDKLETDLRGERESLWSVKQEVLKLTGALNAAQEENRMLREKNQEQDREHTAKQAMMDTQLRDLRSTLLEVQEQRRELLEEVRQLRQIAEEHGWKA